MARAARKPKAPTDASIEFPFRLASELEGFSIADDLRVRRMDEASRQRLLRIKDAKYDERRLLKTFSALPGCLLGNVSTPHLDANDQFCSSNYALTAANRERAMDFNFALKLYGTSCSSLYLGYGTEGSTHFIDPPCYFGRDALSIAEKDLPELIDLTARATSRKSDPKLAVMADMYMYAMSPEPRNESRFIEISIILEMLLLPKSSSELAYRFALRFAKLLSTRFGRDRADAFALGKRIYATRSRLVHTGKDTSLDGIAPNAYEAARILLATYSADRQIFTEENLDALCLGG